MATGTAVTRTVTSPQSSQMTSILTRSMTTITTACTLIRRRLTYTRPERKSGTSWRTYNHIHRTTELWWHKALWPGLHPLWRSICASTTFWVSSVWPWRESIWTCNRWWLEWWQWSGHWMRNWQRWIRGTNGWWNWLELTGFVFCSRETEWPTGGPTDGIPIGGPSRTCLRIGWYLW